ncbi:MULTISPECIES: hypothetical protein [Paenibacillus]|uniref:Uncharacterized protein n=1 Tax=Paenibacillus validus TaxID=44253 RepID=A0A7X3CU71_9BACL|nr:hypothetical protein [Paenibacillus validus]MUG71784.1 hypothetical protein [Paenibacillus validus]
MLNKQTGKWPTVQSSEQLVKTAQKLRQQIKGLDIAIRQLVLYKPCEWGETVDTASMDWVLKELQSRKLELEKESFQVRAKIQLENLSAEMPLF